MRFIGIPGQIDVSNTIGLAIVGARSDYSFGTVDQFGRVLSARNPAFTPMSLIAGEALGSPRAVMLVDGEVFLFDPTVESSVERMIGISVNSANSGSAVSVVQNGVIDSQGAFVADAVYYAGALGVLTQTVPTSGVVVRIGVASSTGRLVVEMSEPLILV